MALRSKKKVGKGDEDLENSILAQLAREYQQQQDEQQATGEDPNSDVTILFCGAKQAGKTSVVDRFIRGGIQDDKDLKPTLALDYKWVRYAADSSSQANEDGKKMLAHIYDLGGEECNDDLVGMPVSPSTVSRLVLAVVVDLSEPWAVMPALEKWIGLLKDKVTKAFEGLAAESEHGPQRVAAMQAARQAAFEECPDAASLKIFPVQLVIVGSKYDLLVKNHDREKIKSLCRAVRFVAHVNGASLVFASNQDKDVVKGVTAVLKNVVFGAGSQVSEQLKPEQPLRVMAGKDSVQGIGAPHGSTATERVWRDTIAEIFPDPKSLSKDAPKSDSAQVAEDLPNYPESAVDGMVEQRLAELQLYRRQVERNQRISSDGKEGGAMAAN